MHYEETRRAQYVGFGHHRGYRLAGRTRTCTAVDATCASTLRARACRRLLDFLFAFPPRAAMINSFVCQPAVRGERGLPIAPSADGS
jgi:hypothetical protein